MERTASGCSGSLKEYAIGVDVFDRDPSYDSRIDPIVRVEARRLRQKLLTYYAGEGRTDSIRIEVPGRGYLPTFRYLDHAQPDGLPSGTHVICPTTVAVLPISGDLNTGFADGLTDEVVCLLSGAEAIRVAAWTSPTQGAPGMGGVAGFPRPVNLDYVLEGTVRRENANVRVYVRLVNPVSGFCVWSEAYELEVRGVFDTQKRIGAQISSGVRSYLRTARQELHQGWKENDHFALALYSEGRTFLNSRTRDGIHQSVECFRQLIDSCPGFALAYSGLADAYSLGARYDVFPHQESWERARSAALDAVRIDYSLAEAHTSLGFVDLHYRRDWGSAEREFCTAILLNPGYAPARQWYGWLLAATGQQELAITALKQAVGMDPLSPNANADLALTLYFSRRYDEAIEQCRRTLALQPGFYRAHQLSGMAHLQKGNLPAALEHLQSAVALTKGTGRTAVLLASALVAVGNTENARQVFASSIQMRKSRPSAMDFALFFAALGDLDSTFEWLERAYQEHDAELLWLSVDPIYDKVRQDPRFSELLSRIGRPPMGQRLHQLVLPASIGFTDTARSIDRLIEWNAYDSGQPPN